MEQKFIDILYELIVAKNLTIKESLDIISSNNKGSLSRTSNFLLNSLLKGTSLSNSMKKCPYINFDEIFISFITYGEKTGNLKETVDFLYKRNKRKQENIYKVVEAALYPSFVILLIFFFCIYFEKNNFFTFNNDFKIYIVLLAFVYFALFLLTKKIIGENKMYEAFLGIGFLLKAGINLYDAIGYGARIVGVSSKNGIMFEKARERLLFGMDLQQAFSSNKKYSNAFFYAEKCGGRTDIFEKIASWIGEEDERKRKLCFSLMEPIFIIVTGLVFLVIVSELILPTLTNLSWI